ncbi:MAG: nucleoside triphosphate pyrophosphohydrolase [Bacteroidetes bacterium]|nr:nucleoside triphosphate pyrophosphohydrolase [Bacteroidota bacterium]
MNEKLIAFERLLTIMDELREKCPWDKKQTIESIRHLTIEETYELSDAIMEKEMDKIKKELGDLLLHIVFYSRIASETNEFNIADVCNSLCEKLIHRHPHIYGDVKVKDEHEVKSNWEKLKLKEGKTKNKSALEGVPNSLPAIIKAHRIQEKARGVGFDWEKPEQVLEKVHEEANELQQEFLNNGKVEEEFGDLLFALINYARFINVNPEDALEKTNRKFIKRFQYLETESAKDGKKMGEMSLAEMDVYWNMAKSL